MRLTTALSEKNKKVTPRQVLSLEQSWPLWSVSEPEDDGNLEDSECFNQSPIFINELSSGFQSFEIATAPPWVRDFCFWWTAMYSTKFHELTLLWFDINLSRTLIFLQLQFYKGYLKMFRCVYLYLVGIRKNFLHNISYLFCIIVIFISNVTNTDMCNYSFKILCSYLCILISIFCNLICCSSRRACISKVIQNKNKNRCLINCESIIFQKMFVKLKKNVNEPVFN